MVSYFTECVFEFLGTLVLMLLGDGVVANCNLKGSKGSGAGYVVITIGWGLAVMCGVFVAGPITGAHLNPAVSLGLAVSGSFPWAKIPGYVVAQMLGSFCGVCLVYCFYKDHYDITDDPDAKLGTFCTMPAIPNRWRNLFCEILGTWVLVFIILVFSTEGETPQVGLGSLGAFPVAFLIMIIGMGLGGTTGYGINPARDLAPRCAHAVLPIKGKRDSGWSYAWVPVLGPCTGAVLAALTFGLLF